MPIVTLRWHFALVDEAAPEDGDGPLAIAGPNDITRTAQRVARIATQHGVAVAQRYPSVASLDAALAGTAAAAPNHDDVQDRAVLLAASGQHAAAREILSGYAPRDLSEREQQAYLRFARQLGRWLDAGGPPIPPLEESLGGLPESHRPKWPPSQQSRQQSRAAREALLAVREKAGGQSRTQIRDLLDAEFTARGLELPSPSEIGVAIDFLENAGHPFGKARQRWRALRMTGRVLGDTVGAIRGRQEPNPGWMAPPDYASYPLSRPGRFVGVDVVPEAGAILRRAVAEGGRHVGPHVLVDLWLSDPAGPGLVVHLGEHTIGTLDAMVAAELADHLRAAATLDENIRIAGRLYATAGEPVPIVEVGLPSGGPTD
jgi:hypothetical protein